MSGSKMVVVSQFWNSNLVEKSRFSFPTVGPNGFLYYVAK